MSIITLRMPAGQSAVAYGAIKIHADPGSTFGVPRYMVPDLLLAGCTVISGDVGDIDVRAELAAASATHLSYFLMSQGKAVDGLSDAAAQAAAVAAFDDRVPAPPTPRQWLERLAPATQLAIHAAALRDTTGQTLLWVNRALGQPSIAVTLQETKDGIAALVAAGILTTADQAALLAP